MKIPFLYNAIISAKKLSLNNYIFHVFLSLVFLASCVSIIGNIITNFPMVANIKWLFSILICILGYYLLHKQLFLEVFKISVFSAILLLVILPSWFYGGGDNNITLLYLMLITIEAFLSLESFIFKCIFTFASIASCVLLLTITYYYPYFIQKTQGQNVYADSIIQVVIIFILSAVSIAIYTNRYRSQHDLLTSLNKRLERLAIIDELSNVYNKRKIADLLSKVCNDDKLESVYVTMIDIDSFKSINDTYGHIMGDAAIKHISDHLTNIVGKCGFVGRYGGDEFMLILYNLSDIEIQTISEKLIKIPPFDKLTITISGGIAKYSNDNNIDQLVSAADELLLIAKNNGKNNIKLWA